MKNFAFTMVMAVMCVMFCACGKTTADKSVKDTVDTAIVDTADTAVADTLDTVKVDSVKL